MEKLIRIHASDNVAVATETIPAGVQLEAGGLSVRTAEEIPAGHKVALRAIAAGENII